MTYRRPDRLAWALRLLLPMLLSLVWATEASAEINTLSSAINKAGRQRMLTQRIVKAYCLVGLKVQASTHRKQLKNAIALFDTQLSELKVYAPDATISEALARVEQLWTPFKKAAAGDVSREGAAKLLEQDGDLLAGAHEVVLLLEKQSTTPVGRLVNLAGRQRMLSQRLAKFYMARTWGIELPELQAQMQTAASEFEDALRAELITAGSNTREIQKELNKAAKQWEIYKRGLKLEQDTGDYIPVIMAATSENLLKMMNKITGMYEQISDK